MCTFKKWFQSEKHVTARKMNIVRKMCYNYQNVSQLEKYATTRKINTVRKMCLNLKMGHRKM